MKTNLEEFLNWQEKNMFEKYHKTDNKLFEFYIYREKDYIGYCKRIITCGYCNKIFKQKRILLNQKYCSYGCQQAAGQLRARLKKK